MDRRTEKELLHLRDWFARAETVLAAGLSTILVGEPRPEPRFLRRTASPPNGPSHQPHRDQDVHEVPVLVPSLA